MIVSKVLWLERSINSCFETLNVAPFGPFLFAFINFFYILARLPGFTLLWSADIHWEESRWMWLNLGGQIGYLLLRAGGGRWSLTHWAVVVLLLSRALRAKKRVTPWKFPHVPVLVLQTHSLVKQFGIHEFLSGLVLHAKLERGLRQFGNGT